MLWEKASRTKKTHPLRCCLHHHSPNTISSIVSFDAPYFLPFNTSLVSAWYTFSSFAFAITFWPTLTQHELHEPHQGLAINPNVQAVVLVADHPLSFVLGWAYYVMRESLQWSWRSHGSPSFIAFQCPSQIASQVHKNDWSKFSWGNPHHHPSTNHQTARDNQTRVVCPERN